MIETFFFRPWSHNKEFFETLEQFILDPSPLCIAVAYLSNKEILSYLADRINKRYPTRIIINTHDLCRIDYHVPVDESDMTPNTITISPALCEFAKNIGHWWWSYVRQSWTVTKEWKQQVMHHKFIVSKNKGLLLWSPNFSTTSFTDNFENIMYISDEKVVTNYLQEFEDIRNLSSSILIDRKLIRVFSCPVCGDDNWIDLDSRWARCNECRSNIHHS